MSYDGTLKFDTKIDSSGFQSGINKLGGIASSGLKATGAILGGAATAIAGIGAAAIKAGSEFEAGMSEVQAISGASAGDMEKLSAKAKEMGAKTKFSASESAEAFQYMAMAGWKTGDMLDGIEGIMNLAAASGEDLATTSDIVTDALTAFGLKAKDSGHFADVLAVASASANTNVGEMGEVFKYVAPVAGSLGMSAEDTAVAIGLMANSGIHASQAGTSLRSALSKLSKPTKEMQDAMVSLGLATQQTTTEIDSDKLQRAQTNVANRTADMEKAQIKYNEAVTQYGPESAQAQKAALDLQKAQNNLEQANYDLATAQEGETKTAGIQNNLLVDSAGNTRSLRDVMLTLRSTFAGMTEVEKNQAAATLFGTEAMSGMLAIINASDEDFEKLTAAIDGCDGAAKDMADTMMDNLQGQITLLKSALEGLGISLYEEMQEPLKDIVKEANNMVGELQEAFNSGGLDAMVKKAGDIFAQVVVKAAEAGPKLIQTAADLVHSFCDSLKSSPGIGDAAATLITSFVKALFSCADDIWTTAIVLAGKIAEGIADSAPEMGEAAITCVSDIIECLAEWTPDLVEAGGRIVIGLIKGLVREGPRILENIISIIKDIKDGLINALDEMSEDLPIAAFFKGFIEGFTGVVGPVLSGVIEAVKALFNALNSLPPEVLEALGKALGVVAAGILGMKVKDEVTSSVSKFSGVLDLFKGKMSGLPSLLTGIVPKIMSAVGGLGGLAGKVGGLLSSIGSAIGPALSSIVGAVGPALASVGTAIVEGIGAIVTALGGWVVVAIVAAIAAVIAVICNWDAVKEFFTETVPNWWNNTVLPLLGKLGEALAGFFTETIPAIASKIGEGFAAVGGAIVDFFSDIIGKAGEWILGMAEKAMEFGGAFIDVITGFFSGLPESIWNFLTSVIGKAGEWIANMASKAAEFGASFIGTVLDFFTGLPEEIWGFLTSIVGKVGEWILGMTEKAMELGAAFIDKIVAFFTDLPYKIGYLLGTIIGSVASWVMEMGAKAAELGTAFIDRIVTFFTELPGKVWEFLVNVVTEVGEWVGQMVQKAAEAGGQFLAKVAEFFMQLPGKIWEFLSGAVESAAQWVAEMVTRAAEAGAGFLEKVAEFFIQLPGRVWEFLSGTFSKVAEWAANMIVKAAEAGVGFVENVVKFITELPGKIWGFLTDIIGKVADWGKSLWEKGSAAAKNLFDAVVNGVRELPGKMLETGKAIIDGVWEGICKAKDTFVKNVKDFFSGIVDGVKDKLGIHSPSKVMQDEVGHPIVDGVTKGIDDKKGEAEGSMGRLKDVILAVASKMTGGMDVESQAGAQAMAENLKRIASAAPNIMTSLVAGSMGALSKLSPQMSGVAEEGTGKFSAPIKELVALTPNIMSGMVASSIQALSGLSSQMDRTAVQASKSFSMSMTNGMASAQSSMVSSGAAMVSGLMQGLNSASGQLYKAVATIASNVVKSMKDALGIHSPSRVLKDEIGQWLPPGIGEGFEDAMPSLERQVDAEMAALAGRMQAAVEIETGGILVRTQENAQYKASTAYPKGGDTYVEEKFEQTNNYHVPVATPSEVSKANRAAARKLLGGVT